MKKNVISLFSLIALIIFSGVIDTKYKPYVFLLLIVAYLIYSLYSTLKSIKESNKNQVGLRIKKMTFSFYFYLFLFLIIRELIFSEAIDFYFLTIFCLFELIFTLESYLEKKYQKNLFYIDDSSLIYNSIYPTKRNIKKLKAINFHAMGNYFALVFEDEPTLTIDRDLFVTAELNAFISQLVAINQGNVIISEESKEKLALT